MDVVRGLYGDGDWNIYGGERTEYMCKLLICNYQ